MPKEVQPSVSFKVPVRSAPQGKEPRDPDPPKESQTLCPNCGNAYRPGELLCAQCGIVFDNRIKTRLRDDPVIAPPQCGNCGAVYRYGEPVCRGCGAILDSPKPRMQDDTNDFAAELTGTLNDAEARPKVGAVQFTQTPIFLEIDGIRLMLPPVEAIVLGRFSGTSGDVQPDIDLTSFGAHEKGVSRRHVQIKRKGTLVLVTDIGSANGTWLNGQRLLVNGERLLRHGDELQLSHLKLRVRYTPLNA
jgi:pSer/pThr/pTyr-binding forkhead associated (FHA) protein